MTLRKISIDNSVKKIPQSENTHDQKPKTTSTPRKQNKKFLKKIKGPQK